MTEFVQTGIEGKLGIVTLNRPSAINALSAAMIADITATMQSWASHASVAAILFEGNGPRGFCAGGDVRAVRELLLAGRRDEAEAYFEGEYRLNSLIANYPKPVIALTHGAVMGGGIGIAGHAGFRITTSDSRFAMPEAAIGFVVDTGVNAILAKAPSSRALLFLLTGLPIGPGDALKLGLTDCVIAPERMEAVRASLVAAASAAEIETAIVTIMHTEGIEAGEADFCKLADKLSLVLGQDSAEDILVALDDLAHTDGEIENMASVLRKRSPTSLAAILMSHRAARTARTVDEVLAHDLAMARVMIEQPDFVEGVRAVLVDKDMAPRWQPSDFAGVPYQRLGEALARR